MAGDVLERLSGACQAVRAGPADAVGDVVPAAVASPATVAEASELLRAACALGLAVVPRGTGTKLGWGPPPGRCDLVVDTTRLNRIIEHAAGDLVVRAQAGVPMAALAAHLAPAGQQLALDAPDAPSAGPDASGAAAASPGPASLGPAGGLAGTVGGVIATGAAGPRRLRYGAPRDLLIGMTVVLADGTVASSGGKVVKNVAGYDIGKLFAGSYGTLGLIAEAAFRLHPLPRASAFVTLTCPTAAAAADCVRAAIDSQLGPSAAEVDRPGPGAPLSAALLIEGAAGAVAERAARMCELLGPGARSSRLPPPWWGRGVAGTDGVVIRLVFRPAALPDVLGAVDEAAGGGAAGRGAGLAPVVRGSAGVGVLEAGLAGGIAPDAVARFVTTLRRRLCAPPAWGDVPGATVTVVRAPDAVHEAVTAHGPVPALDLMRAVKDRFDPGHLMAPGRLAGGI